MVLSVNSLVYWSVYWASPTSPTSRTSRASRPHVPHVPRVPHVPHVPHVPRVPRVSHTSTSLTYVTSSARACAFGSLFLTPTGLDALHYYVFHLLVFLPGLNACMLDMSHHVVCANFSEPDATHPPAHLKPQRGVNRPKFD